MLHPHHFFTIHLPLTLTLTLFNTVCLSPFRFCSHHLKWQHAHTHTQTWYQIVQQAILYIFVHIADGNWFNSTAIWMCSPSVNAFFMVMRFLISFSRENFAILTVLKRVLILYSISNIYYTCDMVSISIVFVACFCDLYMIYVWSLACAPLPFLPKWQLMSFCDDRLLVRSFCFCFFFFFRLDVILNSISYNSFSISTFWSCYL